MLLINALERHDSTPLEACETPVLSDLYILLSDVQRNADDLRAVVREGLLDRLHYDQPVSSQYSLVHRTTRRNRSLKDGEEVLHVLEDAGISRERILSVDREKLDEALDVTELAEPAVYEIDDREYIWKAEVDERKETRLQGLKDQLTLSDDPKPKSCARKSRNSNSGSTT